MTSCPYCSWSDKSYRLPRHLVDHHRLHIKLDLDQTSCCIRAYINHDGREIHFCYCLTCRKGAMGDGLTDSSARWLTLHYGKTECKAAHAAEFAKFKARIEGSTMDTVPQNNQLTMLQNQLQETNDKLETLFDMLKDIRAYVISRSSH
jgi:hypothetical protein